MTSITARHLKRNFDQLERARAEGDMATAARLLWESAQLVGASSCATVAPFAGELKKARALVERAHSEQVLGQADPWKCPVSRPDLQRAIGYALGAMGTWLDRPGSHWRPEHEEGRDRRGRDRR
jgi:hypothetical protein